MLSIRMQRLGRKGHPVYRVVVQDSRQSPDSGKFVARLGSYDPHTKTTSLDKEKAEFYLSNGAQPSERVAALFRSEKVKLPSWVKQPSKQKRDVKNPEKLRKNRPAEETPAEEQSAETAATEDNQSAENTVSAEEASNDTPKAEEPVAPEEEKAEEKQEAEPSAAEAEESKS